MHRLALVPALFLIGCGSDHGGGADGPPGGGDGAGPDAPRPGTYPRLVVAGRGGVQIWDHADVLAAARAPDATLAGVTGALGLAVGDDTLYVTSSDATTALARFAGASSLADGATPTGAIDAGAFGVDQAAHTPLEYAGGDLWVVAGGAIHRVGDAATATTVTAHFTHPYQQIAAMALAGGRLLGGQISGAGVLVWDAAATRTGEVAADWTLADEAIFHAQVAGDRLYASSYSPPEIAIWTGIAGVSTPTPPEVTLTAVCGTGTGAELRYVAVTADDTLIAIHNELVDGGTGQREKVCVFANASTLTGAPAPDAIAEDAALHSTGTNADKAVLAGDRLFVLGRDGVTIFDHAHTAPALALHLPIDGARDLLVLE